MCNHYPNGHQFNLHMLRTLLYFILFIASLVWTITNLFAMGKYYLAISDSKSFMILFICTFLSLSSAILFGYLWLNELKSNGRIKRYH